MTRAPAYAALVATLAALCGCQARVEPDVERVAVPPGFVVELYADGVEDARGLALGANGTLFVGTHESGRVYAISPSAAGGAPRVRVVAEGLYHPHGVAFRDGALYVSEVSRIVRFDGIESALDAPPEARVVVDGLPAYLHHGLRPLRFGPDGRLYTAIGAPCNVCLPEMDAFAQILAIDLGSGAREVVAKGVRNSVGFDWLPATGELWFTDNGRDLLGNDVPGDELNRVRAPGLHYGYPYCHAGTVEDPEFGGGTDCRDFEPPARVLGPHVAALGMRVYAGAQFPAGFDGRILIAEHGSWNREPRCGYRVTVVTPGEGEPRYEVLASWLDGDAVRGRPVDLVVAPDGSVFVSDDGANAIWRIRYTGPREATPALPPAACAPAGPPSRLQRLIERFGG